MYLLFQVLIERSSNKPCAIGKILLASHSWNAHLKIIIILYLRRGLVGKYSISSKEKHVKCYLQNVGSDFQGPNLGAYFQLLESRGQIVVQNSNYWSLASNIWPLGKITKFADTFKCLSPKNIWIFMDFKWVQSKMNYHWPGHCLCAFTDHRPRSLTHDFTRYLFGKLNCIDMPNNFFSTAC